LKKAVKNNKSKKAVKDELKEDNKSKKAKNDKLKKEFSLVLSCDMFSDGVQQRIGLFKINKVFSFQSTRRRKLMPN
jgi:hypothetical protein